LLLAAGAGFWLWRAWPQVLLQSAVWQRALNLELSRLLQAVAEHPAAAGLSLLGFSFAYGVLHALGPGHGKVVITTWLATHPSQLKSSIALTLAASLLQGLAAIVLVVVVLTLLRLPARQLHLSSFWLEKGSYLLVGVLGLLLCWRALKKAANAAAQADIHRLYCASCSSPSLRLRAPASAGAGTAAKR
jgi:ABC-type nickel/cobalt efflux system permease component RcnA